MATLPAAAIGEGTTIVLPDGSGMEFTIARIENSNPEAGQILWYDGRGFIQRVGASTDVEVVSLSDA